MRFLVLIIFGLFVLKEKDKIFLCVTGNPIYDQRILKEAQSLSSIANVELIGRNYPKEKTMLNAQFTLHYFSLFFHKNVFFYVEYNIRLFCFLLFHQYKVAVANDMDTLLAVFLAAKLKGKAIIFDSHEIFSEVPELVNKVIIKRFWQILENILIPRVDYGFTVSGSIIEYYKKRFEKEFLLLRNLPVKVLVTKKTDLNKYGIPKDKILILYQGALNKGRGIELMIESMQYFDENYMLLLIGRGDLDKQLRAKVVAMNLTKKVKFLGRILPHELKDITPHAQLGLSLEEDLGLNYRYALPNKIFDYMNAEIPILVSNLPEMAKIAQKYAKGYILFKRDSNSLANKIINVLSETGKIQSEETKSNFFWEIDEKNLLNIFKKVFL